MLEKEISPLFDWVEDVTKDKRKLGKSVEVGNMARLARELSLILSEWSLEYYFDYFWEVNRADKERMDSYEMDVTRAVVNLPHRVGSPNVDLPFEPAWLLEHAILRSEG